MYEFLSAIFEDVVLVVLRKVIQFIVGSNFKFSNKRQNKNLNMLIVLIVQEINILLRIYIIYFAFRSTIVLYACDSKMILKKWLNPDRGNSYICNTENIILYNNIM